MRNLYYFECPLQNCKESANLALKWIPVFGNFGKFVFIVETIAILALFAKFKQSSGT